MMTGQRVRLSSTEHRHYHEHHRGTVVAVLRRSALPPLLKIELDVPIPLWVYGLAEDLQEVYVAPRHEGDTTEQSDAWPIPVYLCVPRSPLQSRADQWRMLDWALLEAET